MRDKKNYDQVFLYEIQDQNYCKALDMIREFCKHERLDLMNKLFISGLFCLLFFLSVNLNAETATWQGSISSDFNDSANWNPQIDITDDAGDVLTIGPGTNYDPILNYGLSARPNGLNTNEGAVFTITGGENFPYGNNVFNGNVIIKNGLLNNRGNLNIGNRAVGVVTIDGGTLTTKNTLTIGSNSGGNGVLNVLEGIVYFSSRPVIGSNGATGHIYLEEGGLCYIGGNDTSWFQNLADNGTITAAADSAVIVEYQTELNRTCITAEKIAGATLPVPWDTIEAVGVNSLSWRAGTKALQSYVYIGTDYSQVDSATTSDYQYIGNTSGDMITLPGTPVPGQTYYWRVDTQNPWSLIKGKIRSFTAVEKLQPRKMEKIDRGLIALRSGSANYIGWRLFGTDPKDIAFNVYRGNIKLNISPITGSTNFVDNTGSTSSIYSVAAVIDGQEVEFSDSVSVNTDPFYSIDMQQVPGDTDWSYELNDCAVGDLDGDGIYEIVAKRFSADRDEYPVIEAYKLDGTFLWRINLGPNHLHMVEIDPIVYDFDSDGYAEVALRTCEGMTDYSGNTTGDTNGDGITDYRGFGNEGDGFIDAGPEFLSIFDGRTGIELDRVDYIPRISLSQWGDTYGHRANKFHMVVAYLDGYEPSLVICRGIYGLTKLEGWNFRNGHLSKLWHFTSEKWPGFDSQGNHNLTVGDVDSDGKDEIVYGGMCVDNDGTGLYTTGFGHGDAIHMGDMLPDRPGLEVWRCIETAAGGATMTDAATGEVLIDHYSEGDIGRCCAAHIDSKFKGYQVWSYAADGTYNADGTLLSSTRCSDMNFLAWWTGDLQRELLDAVGSTGANPILNKWNGNGVDRLISFYNIPTSYSTASNNYTKGNPCLSGDILGDWREEILLRSSDNRKLRIFTTTEVTNYRIYTLMQDPQYRLAMAWQCCGYNQPPHPGFYIGEGMSDPPVPYIQIIGEENSVFSPDPARFAVLPSAENDSVISMTAVEGYSSEGSVEYLFTEITGNAGGTSSEWQESPFYTDDGLEPLTQYVYTVTMRDSAGNISGSSSAAAVKTFGTLDQPTAIYRFEGNVLDGQGVFNAAAYGEPEYVAGKVGSQAISFDGGDDYLTIPSGTVNLDDITIACWFYLDSANTWQRIFDFGNDTNQYLFLTPNSGSGTLRFAIKNGGSEQALETDSPATGGWMHTAVTLNGNVGSLYINGILVDSAEITIDPSDFNSQVNYIGDSQWSSDPLFNGKIDDFRIYNYALSLEEVEFLALPPSFTSDPIVNSNAIELGSYAGNSLTGYADKGISFSKVSGPGWLSVDEDGSLSGMPVDSNAGENTFTVRVDNGSGLNATAQMQITVDNIYSGTQGIEDIAGFASQWLQTDCSDIPACNGASLDGDTSVTMSDLSVLSQNWLEDDTLQLHITFDEGSGDTVSDSSMYKASPGILVNGPTWDTGYLGSCLNFDGTDDYVHVEDYQGIGYSNARSVTAWIKTDEDLANADTNVMTIASWGKPAINSMWAVIIDGSTGQLSLSIYGPQIMGGPDLEDGQWHHIAVVLPSDSNNINQVKLYVDGDEVTTNAASLDAVINTVLTEDVLIGGVDLDLAEGLQGQPLFMFDGMIDDFRIYNTDLSADTIAELATLSVN